jgi:hypothetical protein
MNDMTTLQVLCRGLRAINRPDVAQLLEGRKKEDWDHIEKGGSDLFPHTYLNLSCDKEVNPTLILIEAFQWCSTPEARSGKVNYANLMMQLSDWYLGNGNP